MTPLKLALFAGLTLLAAAPQRGDIAPPTAPSPIAFRKVVINPNSDFEAASAADIDGDGRTDIVSGDTWYRAPDWTPTVFRQIGVWGRGPDSSGYRSDFADLPVDVNGDGKVDIVSSDYATGELFWHENVTAGLWPRHAIASPGSAETTVLAPILADKKAICVLPNCGGQVVWYELKPGPTPAWIEHKVGREGAGHGIGFGDVDGDGKCDLITPAGWWRQVDAAADKWTWRPEFSCNPGDLGIGTPVLDVDGDRKNDIVFGSGHNYGLYWLHNLGEGKWEQRPIDNTASQFHTLILANLKRGEPAIVTGKRYKAHDHDPGADEPLGLYYYRYDRQHRTWRKFVIDQGTRVGTGLQLTAVDLRKTGRLDILAPGKSGLYLFVNGR